MSILQKLMRPYSSMKALRLLVALAEQTGDCSLASLAATTGLPSSSAYRILQEMQQCGFALKDDDTKRYRVGFNARLLAIELQKTNFLHEAAKKDEVLRSAATITEKLGWKYPIPFSRSSES